MKKFFPRLTVRDICVLGLLISITALLSIFCTFRIGTVVKIPIKFASVFITAAIYGPIWGGIVAASGDLLNCLLAPVGPIIPQITFLEFVSGFIFGVFFLPSGLSKKRFVICAVLCGVSQFLLDMLATTALFSLWLKWFPSFSVAFYARFPAGVLKLLLQTAFMLSSYSLLNRLYQLRKKGVSALNEQQL